MYVYYKSMAIYVQEQSSNVNRWKKHLTSLAHIMFSKGVLFIY